MCWGAPPRPPFIPFFIGGNSKPTISYRYKDDQRIEHASAGTQRDRGNGSRLRVYEVNIWMRHYGRGRPRMVSVAEAERIRAERIRAERLSESRIRAAETRKRR
jgi:hypothetical protein